MNTRRTFLKHSGLLAAGLGLSPLFTEESMASSVLNRKKTAPSDRVNLGVIGLGMGCSDLRGALSANNFAHCIALCDVDKNRRESQAAGLKKSFPNQTAQIQEYGDFRKMLENKEIDGVIMAAPDHWHAYIFNEVLKSGKAIYTEKPIANSIAECNKMLAWQAKYKRVITTGLWQVSQPYFLQAFEILKTGVLGDVFKVQVFLCNNTNPRAVVEDEAVPDYLDYDMWLGPAPNRPYNSARVRGWRSFWDYGGGQQTDWGVHWLDSAFDGLKILGLNDRTYPKSVFFVAYQPPQRFYETPSCQTTIFEYENFHVEWAQQVAHLYNRDQGVAWIGSKATLVCNREGIQLIPEKDRDGNPLTEPVNKPVPGKYEDGIPAHTTNWLTCIRNNNLQTNSPVEKGIFATILAHAANISFRTGTKVTYDPKTQKFVNNTAADAYLKPVYRKPWDTIWN
jgi:predicted dehydrogenase